MTKKELAYIDYIKAAFFWKTKIPLLGALPLNLFMLIGFGILGFGNPAFWLIGLASETAYLLWLSGNERFQNVVDGLYALKANKPWIERQQALYSSLDRGSQIRFQKLQQLANVIEKSTSDLQLQKTLQEGNFTQLLYTFLQLLGSRYRIKSILAQVNKSDIEAEIVSIKSRLSTESSDSPLYRSLQGTLDIATRRLENLIKSAESLKVIESELDRIEKQFALLHEEAGISSGASTITEKLDTMMLSLKNTSQWLIENKEFLGSIEEAEVPNSMRNIPINFIKEN